MFPEEQNERRRGCLRAAGVILLIGLALAVLNSLVGEDDASPTDLQPAVDIVAASLGPNKLQITASDLRAAANPQGQGIYVYVQQTRFYGVERYVVWLVVDDKAYPLNGATKNVTPGLPWPREAPSTTWAKTGLSTSPARDAIELLF